MNDVQALYIVVPGEVPPAPRPRFRVMPIAKFHQIAAAIRRKDAGMRDLLRFFRPAPYEDKDSPYPPWKRAAAWEMDAARRSFCGSAPFVAKGTPLEVRLLIVSRLPKTKERKTVERMPLRDWQTSLRAGDPDNVAKGPLDAAKGVLWHDDTQVAALQIEQVVGAQGEPPRMEMLVWALRASDAARTNFEQSHAAVRGAGGIVGANGREDEICRTEKQEGLPF